MVRLLRFVLRRTPLRSLVARFWKSVRPESAPQPRSLGGIIPGRNPHDHDTARFSRARALGRPDGAARRHDAERRRHFHAMENAVETADKENERLRAEVAKTKADLAAAELSKAYGQLERVMKDIDEAETNSTVSRTKSRK